MNRPNFLIHANYLNQTIQIFIKSKFPKVNPTPTIQALPMGQGRSTFANISKKKHHQTPQL